MVERGVRFINIIYASWDHHSNIPKQLPYNAGCVDQPIAAVNRDLKQRGLLDSTMVVWGSEFGRTPLGENRGGRREVGTGRDHHPYSFSMLMAGGGGAKAVRSMVQQMTSAGMSPKTDYTSMIYMPPCCISLAWII